VIDPGCAFVPTAYTTPVNIVQKYGTTDSPRRSPPGSPDNSA
jgi:hypothetical protein